MQTIQFRRTTVQQLTFRCPLQAKSSQDLELLRSEEPKGARVFLYSAPSQQPIFKLIFHAAYHLSIRHDRQQLKNIELNPGSLLRSSLGLLRLQQAVVGKQVA